MWSRRDLLSNLLREQRTFRKNKIFKLLTQKNIKLNNMWLRKLFPQKLISKKISNTDRSLSLVQIFQKVIESYSVNSSKKRLFRKDYEWPQPRNASEFHSLPEHEQEYFCEYKKEDEYTLFFHVTYIQAIRLCSFSSGNKILSKLSRLYSWREFDSILLVE